MDWIELKDLARALVLPPAAPLIVASFGLIAFTMTRHKRLGVTACAFGLASLWLLATPVVAAQLMRLATPYEAFDLRKPVSAQAIVILAGGVRRYAPEYNQDVPNE